MPNRKDSNGFKLTPMPENVREYRQQLWNMNQIQEFRLRKINNVVADHEIRIKNNEILIKAFALLVTLIVTISSIVGVLVIF